MPRKQEVFWNRISAVYDRIIKNDDTTYAEIIKRIALLLQPEDRVLQGRLVKLLVVNKFIMGDEEE